MINLLIDLKSLFFLVISTKFLLQIKSFDPNADFLFLGLLFFGFRDIAMMIFKAALKCFD